MYKVFVHDGKNKELPDEDIYYIVGKDGTFLKKNLGLMESLVPVDKVQGLLEVQCAAIIHIPKIPATMFAKIYEFFKAVYEEHKSEAVVLLFYNQKTQKYKVVAPSQEVSGAACDYNKGITIKGLTMIGTIHSHGNMSAFHSGTDDKDEKVFDGLHITIGNVNSDYCSISTSVVANGYRAMYEESDYIEGVEEVEYKVHTIGYAYSNNVKRYIIKVPPSKRQFNPNWLKMVEKKTYSYVYHSGYAGGMFGVRYEKNQKLIEKMWKEQGSSISFPVKSNIVKPENKAAAKIAEDDVDTDKCLTCKHKKREYDTFEELYGLDNENKYITYYCNKCQELIDLETDEQIICPACLKDDDLVKIDAVDSEDSNKDNYEEDVEITKYFADEEPESKEAFIKCKKCTNTFMYDQFKPICPFCYTEIIEEVIIPNDEINVKEKQKGGDSPWLFKNIVNRLKRKGVNID